MSAPDVREVVRLPGIDELRLLRAVDRSLLGRLTTDRYVSLPYEEPLACRRQGALPEDCGDARDPWPSGVIPLLKLTIMPAPDVREVVRIPGIDGLRLLRAVDRCLLGRLDD